MIIYKQTMRTEWNRNHDDTRGSQGTAITGTTATTKVGPRGDGDDSGGQSAPGTMPTGEPTSRPATRTSDITSWSLS